MVGYAVATCNPELEEIANVANSITNINRCWDATEQIVWQVLMEKKIDCDWISMTQDEDIDGTLLMWIEYF